MNRFARIAAAFACALALAACATISQRPEVSLSGLDIQEIGLLEQRFGLRLRVLNPNDADISIDGLSYELEVNGQAFAKGVSNRAVTVPRMGEAVVEVSAISNLGGLLRQLNELHKGGREAVTYRLTGRLNAGGLGSVPFEHQGEVALPRLPGERGGAI